MNEKAVNNVLNWDTLTPIEKGAAVEILRTINEMRIKQGEQRDLLFYLREFKKTLRESIESEFKTTPQGVSEEIEEEIYHH